MANTERSSCWSITINNPTESDHEAIATAKQKGWTVEGQLEKGEEGTLHYQLMLRTPQVRFSAVKKHFDRAHIEVAKDPNALRKYVNKEDTRVGTLPASDKYPSMSKLWELIYQQNNTGDKDGWNMCHLPYVELYRPDDDARLERNPLKWFDEQIRNLIRYGYHVESLAVNPQVRACWKSYWRDILQRVATAEIISQSENTTNPDADEVQEVEIPSLPPPRSPTPSGSPDECA